jgi:Uma2 family endonuclease
MAQTKPARLTFQEYLALEETTGIRHELIDGQLLGMVGTTEAHNLITLGLAFTLRQRLQGSGCRVFSENVRLRVGTDENSDGFYPDVMVVCDRNDNDPLFKTRPILLAEVLSAGSLRHDRITKTNIYRTIESLQVHLILSQETPLIELYTRAGNWQRQTFGLDDSFTVPGLECELSVREVYIDVLDVMGM